MPKFAAGDLCEFEGLPFVVTSGVCDCRQYGHKHYHFLPCETLLERYPTLAYCMFDVDSRVANAAKRLQRGRV